VSPLPSDIGTDERRRVLEGAMQAHGRGEFEAARNAYAAWLDRAPDDADALHLLGVLEAQRGRSAEAARLIGRAVEIAPDEAMFQNNLGNVWVELGDLAQAERHYVKALECDGQRFDAANNLGVLLSRSGRLEQADGLFRALIAMAPEFADARLNFAYHLMRTQRVADAVELCVQGLVTEPRSNGMRRLLGIAYSMLGMQEQAVALYQRWIDAEPENPVPRHHLAACGVGAVPQRASDAYVRQVFDSFAASFDARLAELGYRAPALVADWVAAQRAGEPGALDAPWAVIDAGCGTGLLGPLLRPHARRLVGVDLSGGMLRKAAQRQVYDELHEAELVAFLEAWPAPVDLIACADTLCYLGALDAFAGAARRALVPGGRLVATVEAHVEEARDAAAAAVAAPELAALPSHRLHGHGRYSHAAAHVRAALAQAGFEAVSLAPVTLRHEAGEPVAGWLLGAHAPQDSPTR
jgi:predicted TPR repeat methyltransferase